MGDLLRAVETFFDRIGYDNWVCLRFQGVILKQEDSPEFHLGTNNFIHLFAAMQQAQKQRDGTADVKKCQVMEDGHGVVLAMRMD